MAWPGTGAASSPPQSSAGRPNRREDKQTQTCHHFPIIEKKCFHSRLKNTPFYKMTSKPIEISYEKTDWSIISGVEVESTVPTVDDATFSKE